MKLSSFSSLSGSTSAAPGMRGLSVHCAALLFVSLMRVASGCQWWKKAQEDPLRGDHFHPDRCLCDVKTPAGTLEQAVVFYDATRNGYDTTSLRRFEFCQALPRSILFRCDSLQAYFDRMSPDLIAAIASDPKLPRSFYLDRDAGTFIPSDSTRYNPEDKIEYDGDSYTPISVPASVDPTPYIFTTSVGIDGNHTADSVAHPTSAYYTFAYRDRFRYPDDFQSGLIELSNLSGLVMNATMFASTLSSEIEELNFGWKLTLADYQDGGITAQELPGLQADITQHNASGYDLRDPLRSNTLKKLAGALDDLQTSYASYQASCPGSLDGSGGFTAGEIAYGRTAHENLTNTPYDFALDTFTLSPTPTPGSCFTVSPQGQNINITAQAGCENMTYTISITSLSGASVASFQATNGQINLSSYLAGQPPGMYLVTVIDINGIVQTLKISR